MSLQPHNYIQSTIDQLYPSLNPLECQAWLAWAATQPDYYIAVVGKAICVSKVYTQIDPPWLKVGQEVAWGGQGREAVRALHRGMDWARLKGAKLYGYSLAPRLDITKWRKL